MSNEQECALRFCAKSTPIYWRLAKALRKGNLVIHVLVTIEVLDFDHLTTFESKAAKIMSDHGGQFISAFETLKNEDNTGQEIHLLAFPSELAFLNYRSDERLKDLADLRAKAIQSMHVIKSDRLKKYG